MGNFDWTRLVGVGNSLGHAWLGRRWNEEEEKIELMDFRVTRYESI